MGSFAFVLLLTLTGVGCASTSSKDQLRKRAAFDLDCTRDELHVTKIDERTRGVRGCGRRATYIQVCEGPYQLNCTWVKNSESRPSHEASDGEE